MEVCYKRYLNQSYMIITVEQEIQESHEILMLSHNNVPGLLSMRAENCDGAFKYWYDITGKQSFEDYVRRRGVGGEVLNLILRQLEKICQVLKCFMLEEDRLLLRPEYIYLDFAKQTISLPYLPNWYIGIKEEFRKLMEDILQKLDHNDKEAVSVAYDMYQYSLQEEKSFSDILLQSAVNRENSSKSVQEEDKKEELSWEQDSLLEVGSIAKPSLKTKREGKDKVSPIYGTEQKREKQEKHALLQNARGNMKLRPEEKNISTKRLQKLKETIAEQLEAKNGKKHSLSIWKRKRGDLKVSHNWNARGQEEPFISEVPLEDQEVIVHPTEYLGGIGGTAGKLLYQGEQVQPDFILGQPVFLIGKERAEVDGAIDEKSVSRIHARIEKEGENYYLEDLNSTNGTYINGKQLQYKERVKLLPQDRIIFGTAEYLFL